MASPEEQDRTVGSRPLAGLDSPFLEEELFVGESEVEWEARLAVLEVASPFSRGLVQESGPAVEPASDEEVDSEDEEELSLEEEAPHANAELEDYEEEGEDFEEDEKDEILAESDASVDDEEELEDVEEELEAFEDQEVDEEVVSRSEYSVVLAGEEHEPDFEESLPLLFDAENPEPEEEVDEEAELPTDPTDGWVVPEDVRGVGETQAMRYDDAPPWGRNNCAGRLSDGAQILRAYLTANFPGIHKIGDYNCRPNSASPHKLSIHGTGRALDVMIPTIADRANSAVGDPIANWLVRNASALGIQYLIWNRVRWSGGRPRHKFARYTGPNPHRDHIHVELNLAGAQRRTPWFADRAGPAGLGGAPTLDYDKASRLNRVHAVRLSWQARVPEITRLLRLASNTPEERDFVDAVARWQRQQGLDVDGILGPETWTRMQSALPVSPTAPAPSVARVTFPSGVSLSVVTRLPVGENEDYWDPTNSGNPLLDTGPAHKEKKLSANFTVRELTISGGVSADVARIDPRLVECLQQLREHIGRAVTITSGYRSWKRNKEIYAGKKPTHSQHCAGRAADIKIQGMNGLQIGKAAIDACGPNIGVGLGNAFAHIDVRGFAAAWNYGGVTDSWVVEVRRYQQAKGGTRTPPARDVPASTAEPARFMQQVLDAAEGKRLEAEGIEDLEVPGPCPDVPVPASRRPRVLVRGSVHSAVREAQRKLNAFHAYRLAAGLPGLRDAPLVEDCSFGRHTFEAVKSFQALVFPGVPVEHDGKIGSHTWAQLDAIVVGSGPSPAAQLTVEQLRIADDRFTGPLGWDQVIGLDTATLNLELIASGLPPATMPAQIRVELSSRVPNRARGSATLGTPVTLDMPGFGPDPTNPKRIVYRASRALADVGGFLQVERRLKEVATIVRSGGTSDAEFRRALGWIPRGMATQPIAVGASTGSESGEIPDALSLFRSAGVEALEVRVPAQRNWRVPGAIKRLIRSPADVVYYSGHGLSASGKLAIDTENKPCGQRGTYRNWLGPADLTPVWTSPMDLDLLILAGCSVLRIDFSTSPPSGPGLQWARLLAAKGGALMALLGYQSGAPCDSPNGDRIAKTMAERMARGSTGFTRDWLEVNGDNNANNAVAMDARGYWWIKGTLLGGYDIKGPTPIP